MYRALLAVPVAIATAAGGASLYYEWPWPTSVSGPVVSEPSPKAAIPVNPKQAAAQPAADPASPAFDIARISPDGGSVFAGRAAPGSTVTVLANGIPVATAKATENGDWSAVTEHQYAPGQNQLSLSARIGEGTPVAGQTINMTLPGGTRVAGLSAQAQSSATNGATRDFERATMPARGVRAQAPESVPPVTFAYNEAVFTSNGRKAASRLAHYLQQQGVDAVTLTGHADERGSDQYNMELSRQRLDTVARYLRANGFKGKLNLIPKGRSEPYAGVDRTRVSLEQAFQLDRRVELHLTR